MKSTHILEQALLKAENNTELDNAIAEIMTKRDDLKKLSIEHPELKKQLIYPNVNIQEIIKVNSPLYTEGYYILYRAPALHKAAKWGNANAVNILTGFLGANVNLKDKEHSFTPLMHSAMHGHAECVKMLLEARADINTKDKFVCGRTALQFALQEGYTDCILLLTNAQVTARPSNKGFYSYSISPSQYKEELDSKESDSKFISGP